MILSAALVAGVVALESLSCRLHTAKCGDWTHAGTLQSNERFSHFVNATHRSSMCELCACMTLSVSEASVS